VGPSTGTSLVQAPPGRSFAFAADGPTTYNIANGFNAVDLARWKTSDKLIVSHTATRQDQNAWFDIFGAGSDAILYYGDDRLVVRGGGSGGCLASNFDLPDVNPTPPPASRRWGGTVVAFGTGSLTYPNFTISCQKLAQIGFTHIRIICIRTMPTVTANVVENTVPDSHSDAELIQAIRIAKKCGLRPNVAMGVLFPGTPGGFPSLVNPSDPSAWFTSYQAMLVSIATICQAEGVESFSIGQEYTQMQVAGFSSNWLSIATAVRAVFSGPIHYASDMVADAPGVFPHVDWIGFDPYVSLSLNIPETNPATIQTAWQNNILTPIQTLATSYGKPAFIAEIGYQSVADCARNPFGGSSFVSNEAQDVCYEGMLAAIVASGSFLKHIWLWDFGCYNNPINYVRDFSVYGKTAAARLASVAGL